MILIHAKHLHLMNKMVEQFMPHHQQSELKDHSSITTHKSDIMAELYIFHLPTSLLMGQCSPTTVHTDLVEPYIIIRHAVNES